jgi:osmotically-inducible protein OsmY
MTFFKRLSLFCLTVLLATALGCAATSTREGTGEYVDDSAITTKVKAGLLGEPNLNSNDITVETFKGVVQLSGFVTSAAQINTAVVVTRKVKGVTDVRNSLVIKGQQ